VLGRSQVDEEELHTILTGIEAALNSRPVGQGGDNWETLTPSHLLSGEKLTAIPSGSEPDTNKDLSREFRLKQKVTEDFWRHWKREYLLQLRNYHEVRRPSGEHPKFRVGDIVLLQEDIRPRHLWKRARLEDIHPGRDGKIRTVTLRQADGSKISRPVQLVIPLEIDQGGEDVGDTSYHV
jgi:hypothetical protein